MAAASRTRSSLSRFPTLAAALVATVATLGAGTAHAQASAAASGQIPAQPLHHNLPADPVHGQQPAAPATSGASTTEAAAAAAAAPPPPDDTAPAKPLKPDPALEKLPRYEGTLGGRAIIVHLGPKTKEEGVHGEYRYADTGQVILLAGDRDGDVLEIEESNDGTNITGVWEGRFDASGALSADRMNADESDPQPVAVHPVPAAPSASTRPAEKPAAKPAPDRAAARPAGHAVGGVGNLSTGD